MHHGRGELKPGLRKCSQHRLLRNLRQAGEESGRRWAPLIIAVTCRKSKTVHGERKEVLYFLIAGVLFGISAGFSPGPLLALVVSETLQHGIDSGIKVALAPIVTDIPIVALVFLLFTQLSEWQAGLGIISLAGGCYVLYMGYTSLRVTGGNPHQTATKPNSLCKGILTNALSPHPYLFWLGVGVPMVTKSVGTNIAAPLAFVAGFYVFLIGSKIVLAVLVGRSKSFMSGSAYSYMMRFLALALAVFSFLLFYDGLTLLGVIES